MITKNLFGKLPDGREVYRYTLVNKNGMKLCCLNYGGTATELWVPDRNGMLSDVIGGYDCLDFYLKAGGYQGALVGRFANRIGNASFTVDGVTYQLDTNERGKHHIHGGYDGFSKRLWDVKEIDGEEPSIELHIISPDGDQNYPGTLDLTVTYKLTNENGWVINYRATTDKATAVNLTNHSYFNLGGYAAGSILDTLLMIDADTYIPTDCDLIPTGELKSVEGTPFDFRVAKEIGRDIEKENNDLLLAGRGTFNGYDHSFNFPDGAAKTPVKRVEAYDRFSGRVMEVYTDCPAVQLYTGNFLNHREFPFKGGYPQSKQTLFCLETQRMPDSMNHEGFSNCILRPKEVLDTTTEYRFSVK